jgi:hypothetical protein
MMNKLPEDRFQSCQDLHDELNKLKYKEEGSKRLVTRTQINLKGIDLGELKARRKKTDDEKPKKTLFSKNKIMAALGACVFFVVLIFLIKSQSKDNAVSKHKKPPEIKASTLTKVVVPEILDTPLEIIPAGLSTEVLIPYDVSSVGRDLLAEGVFKVGRSVPPMVKLNTSSLIIKSTDKSARGLALTGRSFKNYKLIIQYTVNQPLSHLELQLHRQVANRERQLKLVLSSKSEWNMSGSFILKNAEVEDYSGDQLKLVMTKIPEIKHLRTKQKTQNTLGALNTMEVTCYEKSICIVQNGLTIIKIRDLPVTEGGFMISSSGVSDILVSKIELFPLVLKSK